MIQASIASAYGMVTMRPTTHAYDPSWLMKPAARSIRPAIRVLVGVMRIRRRNDRRPREEEGQRHDQDHSQGEQCHHDADELERRVAVALPSRGEKHESEDEHPAADDQKRERVDEKDDEEQHPPPEVVEVPRRQLLLALAQAVDRGEHPAQPVDGADDRDEADQADDGDLLQPLRVPKRPDERVAYTLHRTLDRRG